MPTALTVELTADIIKLERQLAKAQSKIANFEKGVEKSGKDGKKGFDSIAQGASKATPTLQEFSRVVQDAPFGIIGVGNNITQLVGNFGNLSKAAGGSGAAFKALIASVAGPGGVLLGISLLVTALTVLLPKLSRTKSVTQELVKAQSDAAGSARAQALEIDTLVSVLDDSTTSERAKANALKELAQKTKDYLPELEKEKELTSETRKVIDKYTESLKKQALAKGALELITEKSKELFEIQNDLGEQIGFSNIALSGLQSVLNPVTASSKLFANAVESQNEEAAKLQKEINSLIFSYRELKTNALDGAPEAIDKTTQALKRQALSISKDLPSDGALSSLFALTPEAEAALLGDTNKSITKIINTISQRFRDANRQIKDEGISPIQQSLIDLQESFERTFENLAVSGISGSIANVFASIGDAIASGGNILGAIGNSLLASFGQFISSMGELLIEYGTLAILKGKLDTAIAIGGPAAIAAGIAAVAIGAALVAVGSAFSGVASGGFSGASGQGSQSFSGSSTSSISRSNGFDGGEVVFKIQGRSLIGVLNRELKANNKTVGSVIG